MKIIRFLLPIFVATKTFAGLPPTTMKGQVDSSKKVTFNFQTPLSQSTRVGSTTALIETGSNNMMSAPGFEDNSTSAWTASGLTQSINSTAANVGTGSYSFKLVSSASSQTATSSAFTIPAGFYGNNGVASCAFQGTGTDWTFSVTDGTNTLVSGAIPSAGASTFVRSALNFVFPSSGSVKIVFTSASAQTLYIDDCYVGLATNVSNVSQAQFYGSAIWPGVTNCNWTRTSNASFASFSADSDCTSPTGGNLLGQASAPATKIPAVTFSNMDPGEYELVATGQFAASTGGTACSFRFYDGTNGSQPQVLGDGSGSASPVNSPVLHGHFSYTTSGAKTFEIQATGSTGNAQCDIFATISGINPLQIIAYRFPTIQQQAFNPSAMPASWSGYHNSNCSWARTNTAYGDPSAPGSSCALVERQNQNFGSVTGYGATSGTSALPGIIFTPNYTGFYKVCAMGYAAPNVTGVGANLGVQMADGSSNQLSEAVQTGLITGYYNSYPNCTIINASSIAAYTVKLQTKASAGQITLGGNGGNAIEWSIIQVSQGIPAPFLVGSVTSSSTGQQRVEMAIFNGGGVGGTATCTTSPCSITSKSGPWLTSITRSSTGTYSINIATDAFSVTPTCVATDQGSVQRMIIIDSNNGSATAIPMYAGSTATGDLTDARGNIICMGPR